MIQIPIIPIHYCRHRENQWHLVQWPSALLLLISIPIKAHKGSLYFTTTSWDYWLDLSSLYFRDSLCLGKLMKQIQGSHAMRCRAASWGHQTGLSSPQNPPRRIHGCGAVGTPRSASTVRMVRHLLWTYLERPEHQDIWWPSEESWGKGILSETPSTEEGLLPWALLPQPWPPTMTLQKCLLSEVVIMHCHSHQHVLHRWACFWREILV